MIHAAYTERIAYPTTNWQLGTRIQGLSLRHLKPSPVKHVHFSNSRCLSNGNVLRNRAIFTCKVLSVQRDSRSTTTIREICEELLPEEILNRSEELGFVHPTDVQVQALPVLLSGRDCILHSQTGSGKTLCYLFAILARLNLKRSAVQAIIVVPTRELGMQVIREARKLCKVPNVQEDQKPQSSSNKRSVNVMPLLDGGSLYRQKSWLKADPPEIVVGTVSSICKMIELKKLRTNAINTLVIDEVDAIFGNTEHVALLRTLITSYIPSSNRQTIFASATIPQHAQFVRRCVSDKWTNDSLTHVQINHTNKMPTNLLHRYIVCEKDEKLHALKKMMWKDKPTASIIFVNKQSEASKRKGILPSTAIVAEFLSSLCSENDDSSPLEPLVLEEDSNINARTFTLDGFPHESNILVTTDLAGRGLDIPEVSHVYNFELPPSATSYIHRGGRTARRPLQLDQGIVTTFVSESELFVYKRYENEIGFQSARLDVN